MYTKPAPRTNQQSLFFDLESQLNQKHPLYLLANKIDWNVFEESFKGLYSRPCGCSKVKMVKAGVEDFQYSLSMVCFRLKYV